MCAPVLRMRLCNNNPSYPKISYYHHHPPPIIKPLNHSQSSGQTHAHEHTQTYQVTVFLSLSLSVAGNTHRNHHLIRIFMENKCTNIVNALPKWLFAVIQFASKCHCNDINSLTSTQVDNPNHSSAYGVHRAGQAQGVRWKHFIRCDINRHVYEPHYNFSFVIILYIRFTVYAPFPSLNDDHASVLLLLSLISLALRLPACMSVCLYVWSYCDWFKANIHNTIINHTGAEYIYELKHHIEQHWPHHSHAISLSVCVYSPSIWYRL